jgi:hypothetical protein
LSKDSAGRPVTYDEIGITPRFPGDEGGLFDGINATEWLLGNTAAWADAPSSAAARAANVAAGRSARTTSAVPNRRADIGRSLIRTRP